MAKETLVRLLDAIFVPRGFKRKGNSWVSNASEIGKIVFLDKSRYSNRYYVYFGFIVGAIPLDAKAHVTMGLGSANPEANKRIRDLLDFENEIEEGVRYSELKGYIEENIVGKIIAINTNDELKSELSKRPHLNDIPLVIKNYFGLN